MPSKPEGDDGTSSPSFFNLGVRDYSETHEEMRRLVEKRAEDQIPDQIIFVQHPAVYTTGRGMQRSVREKTAGTEESLESLQKRLTHPIVASERGGSVTFHDPGQLIGYPIIKLNTAAGFGIHEYLRKLERTLLAAVKIVAPQVTAQASQEATGIWANGKKFIAIGVAIRKWVTYHGFAVNLSTDLTAFSMIKPCGLESQMIANLSDLAERKISAEEMRSALESAFKSHFFAKET